MAAKVLGVMAVPAPLLAKVERVMLPLDRRILVIDDIEVVSIDFVRRIGTSPDNVIIRVEGKYGVTP